MWATGQYLLQSRPARLECLWRPLLRLQHLARDASVYGSWFKMASALFEDTALPAWGSGPFLRPPEQLASLRQPQELASGRPKVMFHFQPPGTVDASC